MLTRRKFTFNVKLRHFRQTIVAVGKKYTIYSECVLIALVTQHTKHMRSIILSFVACLALPYFSTLSHKRYDFRDKEIIEHKMCFDFMYKFCLTHLSFE